MVYCKLHRKLRAACQHPPSLNPERLPNTAVSRSIPTIIGLFRTLENVTLGSEIPSEIGLLTSLTRLDLDRNFLSGTVPTDIGSLTRIHTLLLSDNMSTIQFRERLDRLENIGALTRVRWLALDFNGLTCQVLSTLFNLRHLIVLGLSGNQISGNQISGKISDLMGSPPPSIVELYLG